MINQSANTAAFSRDLRRLAAKSQKPPKARIPARASRRGGGGCCILIIIIIVAAIAYAYIDAYFIQPRKKTSNIDAAVACSSVQIHKSISMQENYKMPTANECWTMLLDARTTNT